MLKIVLRVVTGAFVAAAAAWFLSAVGSTVAPQWTGEEARGLLALGAQLGVFFLAALVGMTALRALLKGGRKLPLYLAGGAVVGLAAGVLAVVVSDPDAALRPFALVTSLLAGAAGAVPVSGSGGGPARLTPIGRSRLG